MARYKFDKWIAASLIAIAWVTILRPQLGIAILLSIIASWGVQAIPKLEPLTAPMLLTRTILGLYAVGWFVEFYTGLTPWLSVPVFLVLAVLVAGATSDPYYGIQKDKK